MITELRAQNFKSWEDTGKIDFAPLTGFFGANSSGKTSILQVLLMLKQTVKRPSDWNEPLYFGDEESLVNLGSFDDVIHRPANNSSLDISISWNPIEQNSSHSVSFSTSIAKKYERADLVEFCYTNDRGKFKIKWTPQGYRFISFHDQIKADLFRCYGVLRPNGPRAEFESLSSTFVNLFSQIHYLGPLREYPRHQYTWDGDHPEGVGPQGEKMVPAMLSGRVRLLSVDEQIMKWLQELGLIDSYRLVSVSGTEKDYEFLIKQYKGGPEVRLTDVGFGVSQVLPALILCYYAPKGSILILEQPEAHLHPKVQSELGDVLIRAVKDRNLQIILESHSEHLIHRLMRRTAEGEISADDMALYFCQINEGVSEIEPLDVDEYGNITNWPQEFFGDVTGDLIKQGRAEMDRRGISK